MANIGVLKSDCFIASDISEGDVLQIGGSMIDPEKAHYIKTDFSELVDLFARFDHTFAAANMAFLRDYAEKTSATVDPDMFATLFVIQKVIEKHLWPENLSTRSSLYQLGKLTALSSVVNEGQSACVELSLCAAKVLQDRGLSVHVISGAFVKGKVEKGQEAYNDPHTFLAIDDPDNGQVVIFDPANPLLSKPDQEHQCEQLPSMFAVPKEEFDMWHEQAKDKIAYLEATDALSGRTSYYGAASPNLVFWPHKHVVQMPSSQSLAGSPERQEKLDM